MIDPTGHEAHLNLDPPDEEDELDLVYNDLHRAQEKIKRLTLLCARAADALEVWMPTLGTPSDKMLIAELREASK
jgi:hypothetical protein